MTISAVTTGPDGTSNRLPLDVLGPVGALTYSNAWPGGDTTCAFTLDLPLSANPESLQLGNRLTIFDGLARIWAGVLADPIRAAPWQLNAQGLSTLGQRYVAIDGTGNATTNANTAVAQAIIRGLPWTLTQTLPTPVVTAQAGDVATLLDAVATAAGQRWAVDPNGLLTMSADPTTSSLLLVASDTPGGRTIDDFGTDVWVRYSSSTMTAAPNNPPASAARPFGRWERIYDATAGGGGLSAADAQAMGNGVLKLIGPDPTFTGTLTVVPGDLLTAGGQVVRLSTVRAGARVNMIGVQPDPTTGMTVFGVNTTITIGQWDYDAVTGNANLVPLNAVRRDLNALLTAVADQ